MVILGIFDNAWAEDVFLHGIDFTGKVMLSLLDNLPILR